MEMNAENREITGSMAYSLVSACMRDNNYQKPENLVWKCGPAQAMAITNLFYVTNITCVPEERQEVQATVNKSVFPPTFCLIPLEVIWDREFPQTDLVLVSGDTQIAAIKNLAVPTP